MCLDVTKVYACKHKLKEITWCESCVQKQNRAFWKLIRQEELIQLDGAGPNQVTEPNQPGDLEQGPYNPTVAGAEHYGGLEMGRWHHRHPLRSHQADQPAEPAGPSQGSVSSEREGINKSEGSREAEEPSERTGEEVRPESPTLPPSESARFSIRRTVVNAPHDPDDVHMRSVQLQQALRPKVQRRLTATQQRAFAKDTSAEFFREKALAADVGEYYNYLYPDPEDNYPPELKQTLYRQYGNEDEQLKTVGQVMMRLIAEHATENHPKELKQALCREYAGVEEQPNAIEEVMNRLTAEHARENETPSRVDSSVAI